MLKSLVANICGAVLLAAAAGAAEAPVTTESGKIAGIVDGGVRVYKGIPYAAPPVGDLRWRAPQPPLSWEGVRAADRFGPVCMQELPERALKTIRMSEDCLSLNIWAPAEAAAPLPVMMWIHGGGFRGGTGANPVMNGAALAKQGAVVVTINYRLGDFGLFAHPALTAAQKDEPLANYQLMDQIAALRWIRKNISGFGGDPGRVMIFGESAGGLSVLHLMGSPAASGLFHRAASQSGGGFEACRTLRDLEAGGQALADALGLGAGAVTALRAMPAAELMSRFSKARAGKSRVDYAPVVDGALVTDVPGVVFQAGKQKAVPLLIGANSFEGSLVRPLGIGTDRIVALAGDRSEALRRLYGEGDAPAEEFYGDAFFVAPARFLAASMERLRKPAWLYGFAYIPEEIRGKIPGAHHGLEVPFVFANRHPSLPMTDADMAAAQKISAYWVRFAATGDPNAAGQPPWPAYTAAADALLEFGDEAFAVRKQFRKAKLDFSDELFRSGLRLPSADGW